MTTLSIPGLVVDGHIGDSEPITAIDANSLNGGVLNVKIGDSRISKIMGIKEFGLSHATVAAFTVPPTSSVGVEISTAGTLDGDTSTGDLEEGTIPFLISPSGLTLEDHL